MNEENINVNNQMNQGPAQVPQKTSTMAIVGFVLAFIFPPIGLVVSIIALMKIRKTNEKGMGLANAGIIVSAPYTIGMIIVVVLVANLLNGFFVDSEARQRELSKKIDESCGSYELKMAYGVGGGEGERHGAANIGLCDGAWALSTLTARGFARLDKYTFNHEKYNFNGNDKINRIFPTSLYAYDDGADLLKIFLPGEEASDLAVLREKVMTLDDEMGHWISKVRFEFFDSDDGLVDDKYNKYYISESTAGTNVKYREQINEMKFDSDKMFQVAFYVKAGSGDSLVDAFDEYLAAISPNGRTMSICREGSGNLDANRIMRTFCEQAKNY